MRLTTIASLGFGILRVRTLRFLHNIVRLRRFGFIILSACDGSIAFARSRFAWWLWVQLPGLLQELTAFSWEIPTDLWTWRAPLTRRLSPPKPWDFFSQVAEQSVEPVCDPNVGLVSPRTSMIQLHRPWNWTAILTRLKFQASSIEYSKA